MGGDSAAAAQGRKREVAGTVLLEWLDERYPGRFNASHPIRDWRALSGPEREVSEQKHKRD